MTAVMPRLLVPGSLCARLLAATCGEGQSKQALTERIDKSSETPCSAKAIREAVDKLLNQDLVAVVEAHADGSAGRAKLYAITPGGEAMLDRLHLVSVVGQMLDKGSA